MSGAQRAVDDSAHVRLGREMGHDMLLARSRETGHAVYDLGMMPAPRRH
jgi:hypothetical protein